MTLDEILNTADNRLTLIVGNGVNRYANAGNTNSWRELLLDMARRHLPEHAHDFPTGISTTEFFDVLSLQAKSSNADSSLQKEFCKPIRGWLSFDHHRRIVDWARHNNSPILTTNFDTTLSRACGAVLQHVTTEGFTDFYPWSTYYGHGPLPRPSEGFGVWHMNGMAQYHRSVRLGLTHYMGSVQRVRDWMHRGGTSRLFSSERAIDTWRGRSTWLDALFRNDLAIVGLALDEVEVFIRWLLIERARLYIKFPSLKRKAWYIDTNDHTATGKGIFLSGVGVTPIMESNYDGIYAASGWKV
ncbi:hypothetical protein [Agrobacterium tumefaciens]|uniref:hypothetical protein n=1 Tax=Agrobacterium tumefaciens TaxID=358 RepID=UPI001573666A|nr:hypothetical protein [Agrobacterium tumefaciens]WCK21754.1 hypothetical protein G6M09_022475 [Agrobacterium tumefaciens]